MIIIPIFNQLVVSAEEAEKYPYNLFGRNGITMNASNLCVNGNIHTNKEAQITANNRNINGKVTTGSDINKRVKHVYSDVKIQENYFMENCDLYEEEYFRSEMNININNPVFSYGSIFLDGNVALNSNIGTLMNINITGEVKNANTAVVYSKYGDITIQNDSTANINGLIYAPLGTLTINSPNINLNGIIIADKVIINGSSVNINNHDSMAQFIGNTSEAYDFSGLEYLPESWLGDSDSDDLFDIYEKVIDTDPLNPDTDSDELPDGYEVLTLSTDPLEIDTDFNGIWDKDEDFDSDNLNNLGEYQNKTGPFIPDTDEDGLLDGDEVHTYATDPLNPDTDGDKLLDGEEGYNGTIFTKYGVYFDPLMPDTDGDGELDGDEVFGQTKQQQVQTHDEKITNITVDMSTNGNIDRNLSVESMYNVDTMSTNAYALVGEPFNFTSSTSFESATITFTVDQSKLGDTKFDDLIILWYNEESQNFEEMPTSRDSVNSTVSTTTTHFSQYMVVDSVKWYEQWQNSCNELNKMWIGNTTYRKNLKTIFLLDCSYKMESVDDIDYSIEIGYNGVTEENYYSIINDMNNPSDVEFCLKNFGRRSCDRTTVCENVINTMNSGDSAAIITFSNEVLTNTGMSSNWSTLTEGIQRVNNDGEASNLNLVLPTALSYIDDNIYDTYRIIVVTHSNIAYYYDGLLSYNYDNVELNIVNLGPGSISPSIEGIVNSTGGKVYDIVNASQLVNQVGEIVNTPPQFIGKDSDGDTIPDIVESYGLKPNGQPIGTNPNLKDTDFDGLDDNVEINYLTEELVYPLTFEQTYMFSCTSDPTKADSDGDGLDDYYYTYEYPEETTEFYKDNRPLKKGIYSSELEKIIIGELTIISECPDDGMLDWKWAWPPVNVNAGHSFFVYKSYVNDTLDFSGFYRGFELGTWERQEPGYYKINVNEKVAIGNSGDTQDYSGLDQITRGGIYFNREVKNAFNGGKTYGINSYLTKKITQNQLDKVIKVCKNHNYYDLIYNNCAYVACEAWNQSFNDNLNCWTIVGEDILYLPKTLRKSISKRKESKDNYDILFEFSFCN